jgi:hypothetical protein
MIRPFSQFVLLTKRFQRPTKGIAVASNCDSISCGSMDVGWESLFSLRTCGESAIDFFQLQKS